MWRSPGQRAPPTTYSLQPVAARAVHHQQTRNTEKWALHTLRRRIGARALRHNRGFFNWFLRWTSGSTARQSFSGIEAMTVTFPLPGPARFHDRCAATSEHLAWSALTLMNPTCTRANVLRLFMFTVSGSTRRLLVRWLPS